MDLRRFAMNYGAFLGLCLVAAATLMWAFGLDKSGSIIPSVLNNGLIIAGIIYSIINYRDIEKEGYISYSNSLKLGTSVAFFSSVLFDEAFFVATLAVSLLA